MLRRLTATTALLILTAAAARPTPLPPEGRPQPAASAANTVWAGDGVCGPTVYYFRPGGVLTLTYNGRTHHGIGSWKQTGATLYWESCGRYCEFRGVVADGKLTGKAWNVAGGTWALGMTRKGDGPPPKE